jgi:hypothetical protein
MKLADAEEEAKGRIHDYVKRAFDHVHKREEELTDSTEQESKIASTFRRATLALRETIGASGPTP